MNFASDLEEVCQQVVAPQAVRIDQEALFPREAMVALGRKGLLGLVSAKDVGGMGGGLREAAQMVQRLAQDCGSTAMVTCMHFCATALIEAHGPRELRSKIAAGQHLSTLAFSESGSRSLFWAPIGEATLDGRDVVLNASKSWVTSAGEADSYVWSSKPLQGSAASSLWWVDAKAAGLSPTGKFDGLGLRGNASTPVRAQDVRISPAQALGPDGGGFDLMMGVVMPWFACLSAAGSLGLCEGVLGRAIEHVKQTQHQHLGTGLADLPTIRAYLARARIQTDMAHALLQDSLLAIESGRADTLLRVLQIKAAAAEVALDVSDTAMRVCGGAAFRRELGVERSFRDARAAHVMAPTSDVLYDFVGKLITGQALF